MRDCPGLVPPSRPGLPHVRGLYGSFPGFRGPSLSLSRACRAAQGAAGASSPPPSPSSVAETPESLSGLATR